MKVLSIKSLFAAFTASLVAVSATSVIAEGPAAYVALGDSAGVGVGATNPESNGYVPLVHESLQATLLPGQSGTAYGSANGEAIRLANFSVSGETTASMLAGGQLDDALAVLRDQNSDENPANDVRVVSLGVGGNDGFAVLPACVPNPQTAACGAAISGTLTAFALNFDSVVGQLREAAGPQAMIAVMTYYNPLTNAGCSLAPYAPLAALILEGGGPIPAGLNDIIRLTAAAHGAVVAETFGVVGATDVQPDCRHPNDSGHAKIANAFVVAIES